MADEAAHQYTPGAFPLLENFLEENFHIEVAWGDTTFMLMTEPIVLVELDPSTLMVRILDIERRSQKEFSLYEVGSLPGIQNAIRRRIRSRVPPEE